MGRLFSWFEHRLELDRAGASSNLRPMEGMRGIAVFLVFIVHCMTFTMPWWSDYPRLTAVADQMHSMGNVGVDLFFVLSGFLIYGAVISKAQPFKTFIARRARRIYPAFTAVFVVYLVLSWLSPSQSKIPAEAGAAALYIAENYLLLPGLFPIEPMIAVAWSLSYEFFYYLMVPLLIGALSLRSFSRRQRVGLFLVLGLVLALVFATFGGPVRLLMFIAGILLFEALPTRFGVGLGSLAGAAALGLSLAVAMAPAPGSQLQALKFVVLGGLFFVLCLSAFRRRESRLARTLSWTPLRWLGNISYSYYLVHGLALQIAVKVLGHVLPAPASSSWLFFALPPALFAFSLLPSLILFLLVERPFSLVPATKRKAPATQPSLNSVLPGVVADAKEKS